MPKHLLHKIIKQTKSEQAFVVDNLQDLLKVAEVRDFNEAIEPANPREQEQQERLTDVFEDLVFFLDLYQSHLAHDKDSEETNHLRERVNNLLTFFVCSGETGRRFLEQQEKSLKAEESRAAAFTLSCLQE